jgi:hypothetical protein
MELLTIAIIGAVNIMCFVVGAKVGQTVAKGERVNVSVNPVKAVKDHQARKEAEYKQSRIDTILRNVDCYDGTPYGQQDVPGR